MSAKNNSKKRILYISNKRALSGGIGTVIDHLNEEIDKSDDFQADNLITEGGNKKEDTTVDATFKSGNKEWEEQIPQRKLEQIIAQYDIVHMQGVPHFGVFKAIKNVKKRKNIKVVSTVHSSVKKDFLARAEQAQRSVELDPTDREARNSNKKYKKYIAQGMLDKPGKFIDSYWGSAVYRQSKSMGMSDIVQHMNNAYLNDTIAEFKAYANKHKHVAIPHGVSVPKNAAARPKKKRLLYVGRFSTEKGIDDFVEALPLILARHPDAEIKFVGGSKDGEITKAYKEKTEEILDSNEMKRVHFTGWVTDKKELQKHYEWSDYLVVPSVAESFCLVAAEALMNSRIPIITKTSAMDELFVSKGIAFGIDETERHSAGIAQAINSILDDCSSEEHDRMAERGRKYAIDNYSVEQMAEKQLDLYRNLLGMNPRKKAKQACSDKDLEKYVRDLTDSFELDRTFKTFGSDIGMFSTYDFKHKGVVVKKSFPHTSAQIKNEKEFQALQFLNKHFAGNTKYKVPELLKYHAADNVIVQQRLYGPTALEMIVQHPEKGKEIMEELVGWVSELHKSGTKKMYRIEETEAYAKFEESLEKDAHKFGELEEFKEIQELIKEWAGRKFCSKKAFLQGDLSPIHFYFEEDGLYSIDFNAARNGPVEEDIASFISNARMHIANKTGDIDYATELVNHFVEKYSESTGTNYSNRMQFYVAYFNYLKTRMAKDPEQAKPSLQKIVKMLRAKKYKTSRKKPKKCKFKPTKREDIESITEKLYSQSNTVADNKWVGAGRKYFVRGTSGYIDNILPVNGMSVRQALSAAKKRAENRPVKIMDIGCANGHALYQLMRTVQKYDHVEIQGRGISGNELEFLTNPPVKGKIQKKGEWHNYNYTINNKGQKVKQHIQFQARDMHNLPADEKPDVLMSVACVKYSHDPWKVFAGMLRTVAPEGHVFVGHLLEGTGENASKQPIYDRSGREMTPKQYIDALAQINPGMTLVCNEDENRMVTNEKGEKVFNDQKFYAKDKELNKYRSQLINERKQAETKKEKKKIDKELRRVSPNGFFSVSAHKGNVDQPFMGLLYVGNQYGEKTQYLFEPSKKRFDALVEKGYVPV